MAFAHGKLRLVLRTAQCRRLTSSLPRLTTCGVPFRSFRLSRAEAAVVQHTRQSSRHMQCSTVNHRSQFHTSTSSFSSDPAVGPRVAQAADLSIQAYHGYADEYLELLVSKLEELGETKLDLDVEYHSGVLNCVFPPNGTYVLNKQPPNKQIWLSSPVSGPKRYDYVLSPGQAEQEGEWVYLRDGTKLSDLLRDELKVDVSA